MTTTPAPALPGFQLAELRIQNVKRIEVVELDATGAPIILTGDNGNGKSSILDSIELLLSGKGLSEAVRKGSGKGSIRGLMKAEDGTTIKVQRDIKEGGASSGSLKVYDANNELVKSPQEFLNGITGDLAFDPAEFLRMKPKDQAASLQQALGVDFTVLDKEYAVVYSDRTLVNRDCKTHQTEVDGMESVPFSVPDEPVSVTDLTEQIFALGKQVQARDGLQAQRQNFVRRNADTAAKIERLSAELDAAYEEQEKGVTALKDFDTKAEAVETAGAEAAAAIEALQTKLENATAINQQVTKKIARKKAYEKLDAANKDSAAKTARLKEIDTKKAQMLADAQCPIPGLTFGDSGIKVDDILFESLSTAEQIRIAASIAMIANPRLRLILIREGALMSRANLAGVCGFAKEKGWQVWIEKFQEEAGAEGLHIVDGRIAFVDGKPV